MLGHRASTIIPRCRPELMLTRICYMPRSATVLVYSCHWTLTDESVKASIESSQIGEGVLFLIQVWSTLQGRLLPEMGRAHETSLRSLLSAVSERIRACGAVYQSDCDTQLGAYVSNIQQSVHSNLAILNHGLDIFFVMMALLIFNTTLFPCVVHPHSKSAFPFFSLEFNVARCYRLHLFLLRAFLMCLLTVFIIVMLYTFSVGRCDACVLLVGLCPKTV